MRSHGFEMIVRGVVVAAAAMAVLPGCGGGSGKGGLGGQGGLGGGGTAGSAAGGRTGVDGSGGSAGGSGLGGRGGTTGNPDGGRSGGGGASAPGGAGGTAGSPGAAGAAGGAGVAGMSGTAGAAGGSAGTPGTGAAGAAGAAGRSGAAGASGMSGAAGAAGAAGGAGGAPVVIAPELTSLVPLQGVAGAAIDLSVHGKGIAAGWTIYFDGQPLTTTIGTGADGAIATSSFTIPPATATGQVQVWLASGAATSNILYFTVQPAAGAPKIIDYTPDNALPGATISIVGTDLASGTTITDPLGRTVAIVGTGTLTWVSDPVERVDVVIPADMPSGTFTATNNKGSFRGRVFNVGMNLARLPGATATSSTQFNTSNWSTVSGFDNDLQTSWFSAHGDCATATSCTHVPTYQVNFPSAQVVGRIAMRGNREYASGYDFLSGRFEVLGANNAVIWSATRQLPEPDRDLDIKITPALTGATAVRFVSTADESDEPGFAELEVFGP